ncbi:hypothetical protein MO973_07500 [Paenibacillus sp. TRM 82003]|nr:hypothetical protein [Paenibacillus sp. TRM 82003]
MKALGKMIHYEIQRFRYALAALMAFTAVCQFGALLWTVLKERALRESEAWRMGVARSEFGSGPLSFDDILFASQNLFGLPILVGIAVIGIYIFLIWYRDWLGRSTFIYRLLMLPTQRRNIYIAKLIAILTFVFSLISFQLLLLALGAWTFRALLPAELREASHFAEAIAANPAFSTLLPPNFSEFLFSYGLGAAGVIVAFTSIVIERCYRRPGIVYGILYAAVCAFLIIAPMPMLGMGSQSAILYPEEIFAIELVVFIFVVAGSLALSFRLLRRNITV